MMEDEDLIEPELDTSKPGFALIVQALPATGKTTLAEKLSEKGFTVIDSDVVWWNLDGTEKGWDDFIAELTTLATSQTVLFTNCWVEDLVSAQNYIKVFPEWNTWLETLMDNRQDLQCFGFGELKEWYASYEANPTAIKLEKGEYLSDCKQVTELVTNL